MVVGESSSRSYWDSVDRRHRALIALGAGLLVVTLTAGGVVLASRYGSDSTAVGEATRTITPAEQTTAPVSMEPSYEPTATSTATDAPGPGSPSSPPGSGISPESADRQSPATYIAYRRDGWLCVTPEGGGSERRIVASASGPFSLSPDGTLIACVDESGQLSLYDVTDGSCVRVGPAESDAPVWAPDSLWLAYTAPGPKVTRVDRGGTGVRALMPGCMPAVSPDGTTVAAASPASLEPAVVVWKSGAVRRYPVPAAVAGVACDRSRIYIGTGPDASGKATLRSMALDGGDPEVLVGAPHSARAVSFGPLSISPDGVWLAFAEQGDDGYSVLFGMRIDETSPRRISGRRDAYPLQWSATDTMLYFIEGNALQGNPTSLVSVSLASGVSRTVSAEASR